MKLNLFLINFCCNILVGASFKIDFPAHKTLTYEDYYEIQNKVRQIDITEIINKEVEANPQLNVQAFLFRMGKIPAHTFIDSSKGWYPIQRLEKIGNGGDCCIVSYASFNGAYPSLIEHTPEALQNTGFNGYYYYRIGGYPTPEGDEIKYAGVPYAFKIFMMQEAVNLGFSNVLWIDSSLYPLNDPSPIFEWIEENEVMFFDLRHPRSPDFTKTRIPISTVEKIKEQTGVDVITSQYISGAVFGLKMNCERATIFTEEFQRLLEMDDLFISSNPEEFVWSAIMGSPIFQAWQYHPFKHLLYWNPHVSEDAMYKEGKENGFFFSQRNH